jgi:hypothetical protein
VPTCLNTNGGPSARKQHRSDGPFEPSLRRGALVAVMQPVHLWNLDDASGGERRNES